MKVILLADVKTKGKKNDIINVSDGYASNFLLPKKLAVEASTVNMRELNLRLEKNMELKAEQLEEAQALSKKLADISLSIEVKAGEGGKLFGAVTSKEIAVLLSEKGFEVDKKRIVLPESIKNLGLHEVAIKIHPDVDAKIKVNVVEG